MNDPYASQEPVPREGFDSLMADFDKAQELISKLKADREAMLALIVQADPWVQTRMHRHHRKAESEKRPYYQANHARESDRCEGWLVGAAQFLPPEYLQEESTSTSKGQ